MSGSEGMSGPDILDLVHDSIIVRDMEGRILQWNSAAESQYGWVRGEVIGRNLREILSCRHSEALDALEAELVATGSWEGELSRLARDGREICIDARWSLSRGVDGRPSQIVETGRDITERRAAEKAIRLNEYRFRNLFQAMAVAFWEIDFRGVGDLLIPLKEQGVTDLRAHLSAQPDLVREAMRRARVLDVNERTMALFGAPREEIVGADVERYWPEASFPVFIEALVGAMEKHPSLVTETKLLDFRGNELDVLFTVSWSAESRREGIILLGIIDIGDRKRAFEALERSELRYKSIFNRMPFAFWQIETGAVRAVYDRLRAEGVTSLADYIDDHPEFVRQALDALVITDVNDETVRTMGARDRSQLLGPMARIWTDAEEFVRSSEARFQGAQTYTAISKVETLDGRTIDLLWTAVFADQLSDTGINLIGAIDVTDRRKAVEELARSELKYRNLFQHMPLSLCQLDVSELVRILGRVRGEGVTNLDAYMDDHPDFLGRMLQVMRVEQVNEQTVRLFGGRDSAQFVGPIAKFWRGSEETVRRSLAARYGGAETYSEETRMQTLDGRTIEVFYTSAFPKALSELGIGLVGIIDVGDRLEAERMLQQVQADFAHAARVATLGELTASIAHEVNQPLAAIATNGEASLRWLDRPEPNVAEVRVLAGRMVADARRAADVIGHIRTMATRHVPERESLSVNEVIAETLGFLQREFQARDVGVTFLPAADLPPAFADRTQLQQVVVNLAVNAVQAMAQGGGGDRRLTVRTLAAAGGKIRVEVDDSGPGVAPDDLRRLFESFYSTRKSGLGLGLSICRSIVEAHGGEIGCENTGSGALFSFTLPTGAAAHTNV